MDKSKAKELQEKTCCFTGHRTIPASKYPLIAQRLEETVIGLIEKGVVYFGAGGALGFDMLAENTILRLKERYPFIKLILVLPCESQADRWSAADRQIYEEIRRQADKVKYTSREYTRDCMFKRNRHLVDCCGVCVCYLTKDVGGTAYTVEYARKKGVPVVNLAEGQL